MAFSILFIYLCTPRHGLPRTGYVGHKYVTQIGYTWIGKKHSCVWNQTLNQLPFCSSCFRYTIVHQVFFQANLFLFGSQYFHMVSESVTRVFLIYRVRSAHMDGFATNFRELSLFWVALIGVIMYHMNRVCDIIELLINRIKMFV